MLADIAGQAASYTPQCALTLFSMLALNTRELAAHPLPPSGTDKVGGDGVLYRFMTGHGFEFHPLGELRCPEHADPRPAKTDQAKELADALVARGVPVAGRLPGRIRSRSAGASRRGARAWRRPWPLRPSPARAQATADQDLLDAAGQAYAAIPGRLVRALPQGPWIKLYSFDAAPVLNAQLQTVISVGDYAQISGNTGAAGLAAQLQATAEALLPRFDTGFWSLYSLGGGESPLSYHDYVVQLLRRLAARTGDTTWSDAATKFQAYETQAPVLKPSPAATAGAAATPIVIYPDPQDGYLDTATFSFWLSKLSTVTLRAGGRTESVSLGHGPQSITWSPGLRAPGTYYPALTAVDAAGNSATHSRCVRS